MNRLTALVLALSLSACGVESVEEPPTPPPTHKVPELADGKPKTVDKSVFKKPKPPPEIAPSAAPDGWMAPASTRPADMCKDAPDPIAVDQATLTPTPLPAGAHPALTDPTKATETAPDLFQAKFTTNEGDFVIEVHRDWAPLGADRFYNLVKIGYFDDSRPFRNIGEFMMQFGIHGSAPVNDVWKDARIADEPVKMGNYRGVITFAKCGMPNCRSTQLFINHKDNLMLDRQGFSGFGRVVEGMDVVDKLYPCYGEGAPRGKGPRQDIIQSHGNAYLDAGWPLLSKIEKATIVE